MAVEELRARARLKARRSGIVSIDGEVEDDYE